MSNVAVLFVCLMLGVVLRASGKMAADAHQTLNSYIVHVALPALILFQIHRITIEPRLIVIAAMPWLLFAFAVAVFFAARRVYALSRPTLGALIFTAGLANTSFVGLPMIESYFGPSKLWVGILIDQLGTYLVLSTAGILLAAVLSEAEVDARSILKRVTTFPPLIALVIAVILIPVRYPDVLDGLLKRLGDTLAPVALVSVGLQLRLKDLDGNRAPLCAGLAFKLLLAPAVVAVVYLIALGQNDEVGRVTVFESAMGPMIGGAIVASQHNLNPPLVALMVGVGIAVSFVTLPVWSILLHG